MNFKKMSSILLSGTLVMTVMTGCSNNVSPSQASSENQTSSAETTISEDGRPMNGNVYTDGKLPLVKEKETIKIAIVSDVDPNESLMAQELEEKTNVHVEWDYYPQVSWQEKKNLLFASGDLPDAIMGRWCLSDQELNNYSSQGLVIPLNDYISEETMPYLYNSMQEHPEILPQTALPDGTIYSFPGFDFGNTNVDVGYPMYINQTWLDNLGLEMPTTTEDFYQTLKAFKEQDANGNGDPNDEIPYSFQGQNYETFNAFGVYENGNHLAQKDGKVYYTAIQPEYKEAIKYFNKLYTEGLIDQEAFTQDGAMYNAKWKAGEDGSQPRIVGAFSTWRTNRAPDYVPLVPVAGPTGIKAWPQRAVSVIRSSLVITNQAKNPDLLAAWANQIYEPDYSVQSLNGYKIGEHMELKGDKFELVKVPDLSKDPDKSMFMQGGFYGVTKSNGDRMFLPPHIEEKKEIDELYREYIIDENIPNVSLTLEESELVAGYNVDINEYVKQMYAKWIMNGGIDQEWDGYIQKLESMGVDRLVEIYQTAIERYNELLK